MGGFEESQARQDKETRSSAAWRIVRGDASMQGKPQWRKVYNSVGRLAHLDGASELRVTPEYRVPEVLRRPLGRLAIRAHTVDVLFQDIGGNTPDRGIDVRRYVMTTFGGVTSVQSGRLPVGVNAANLRDPAGYLAERHDPNAPYFTDSFTRLLLKVSPPDGQEQ